VADLEAEVAGEAAAAGLQVLGLGAGGSRVHSSECTWLRAVAGREDMVSAKSLAPRVLARDDWLHAVAVEEGHLPCRGRPDRGGLRRWVPAAGGQSSRPRSGGPGLRERAGQGPAGNWSLVRRGSQGRPGDRPAGRHVDRRLRPGRAGLLLFTIRGPRTRLSDEG
jgi:hypothetical protein